MNFMKRFLRLSVYVLFSVVLVITLDSCLKGEFDTPPTGGSDPEINESEIVSLQQVMATYFVPGKYTTIDLDKYIKGVVVADDKSGNFYKTIIVEDDNSELGIAVLVDENEIHASYPVGRRVFIKLKGLTISDYNNLPQLGLGIDNSGSSPRLGYIPSTVMTEILVQGSYGNPVTPRVKKITELTPTDYNTLIRIEGVQFSSVGPDKKYADNSVTPPVTINQDLTDCFNNKVIVRNSGYADFAGELLPDKNGSITAVYSIFRTDKQLFIRDPRDINFTNERCGGTSGAQVSIQNLRAQFQGTPVNLSAGFVKGIVISDAANKNINTRNMVVQEGDAGIVLRFTSNISVPLGAEVKVGLTGGVLGEYETLLQVDKLSNSNVEVLATGKSIVPKELTIAQVDMAKHESTLITVKNATLTGGSTYKDMIKVKDATGEIDLYTIFTAATFAATPVKSGSVSITGILGEYKQTRQLSIRNLDDVQGGSPCDVSIASLDCDGDGVTNAADCAPLDAAVFPGAPCNDNNANTVSDQYDSQCVCKGSAPGDGLDESFSSQTNNVDITLAGWLNIASKGARKWQAKVFSNNIYAQATAYNDQSPEMDSWLITPEINTDKASVLSFETAKAFWVHNGLTVLVSSNFVDDPTKANWVNLNARVAVKEDADNTFIPSGNIDLKAFGSKVRVAFRYEGKAGSNTSTYRVDNVKVK